jgi:hypothetical protein
VTGANDHRTRALREADRKADQIARELVARGLPVVAACTMDSGSKVVIAFQLADAPAKYGVRCSIDEANADWFERMYRVVA